MQIIEAEAPLEHSCLAPLTSTPAPGKRARKKATGDRPAVCSVCEGCSAPVKRGSGALGEVLCISSGWGLGLSLNYGKQEGRSYCRRLETGEQKCSPAPDDPQALEVMECVVVEAPCIGPPTTKGGGQGDAAGLGWSAE